MSESQQLLAEYAQSGSESAFRELVARYINLVYGTAVRCAGGDRHLAEDVTQTVFIHLARKARSFRGEVMLGGWLHRDACNVASKLLRGERRRQQRERLAAEMNTLLNHSDADLNRVASMLDGALDRLAEEDRAAIFLRFFEEKDFRAVGETLGISEDAARKRVTRAVEKLQVRLRQRGVHSSVPTLMGALVAAAALAAPSTLAATVATGALTAGSAASPLSVVADKFLAAVKTKTAAGGALAVAATAFLLYLHFGPTSHPPANVTAPAAALLSSKPNVSSQADSTQGVTMNTNSISSQMGFQLLDAETSDPLPGAKLYLFYLLEDGRGKTVRASTDANGRLAVDKPQAPYRALNFFVTAAGRVPKVISWGFRRPMPSQYTMTLERGLTIGGVVIDESGQPIPGAKIEFDGPGNEMSLAENIQFGPDTAVTADASGQWWCDLIPRQLDEVSVIVTHPEHAETHLGVHPAAPGATRLTITMSAGFTAAGLVQDANGNPIEGARVRQVRLNQENEKTQATDASGAFQFKNMAAGELVLAVQANGFAPAVQSLQLTGNVPALRFHLGPGQLLRGRVVDEQGNPVANAFVETTRRAMDKVRWSTNTDANGLFQWDSAPPEPLLYSVLAEGFKRAYSQTLKADGSDHEIKLTRSQPEKDRLQITGTVLDADTGAGLHDFKVFISEQDAEWAFPLEFYTSGSSGAFTISIPPESRHPGYRVQVEEAGYLPAVSGKFLRKDGNQTMEFKLRKGTGPSGVVLLPNGKPAAEAAVLLCTSLAGVTLDGPAHIQPGLNTTTYRTQADARGQFSLTPAVDPRGLIVVHQQGFLQTTSTELSTGATLRLQPWARLEGKLILESRPAANEQIVAAYQAMQYTEDGRHFGLLRYRLETTTDAEGRFVFEKVPPGECKVFRFKGISNAIFSSNEQLVTATAGGVTQVVLGGTGRPIIGKAVFEASSGVIDWTSVVVGLSSGSRRGGATARPKREDFPSGQAFIKASKDFFNAGNSQQHFASVCANDGSFRIPNVPSGTYQLVIDVRDVKANSAAPHDLSDPAPVIASLTRQVSVPDDQAGDPLDLGTLELMPAATSVSGQ